MAVRDFKTAANLFLDTVATFTSYELMDYKTFVTYTVFCGMIALDRQDIREKVACLSLWLSYIFAVHIMDTVYIETVFTDSL